MEVNFWLIWGLLAQGCFFSRFLIQWIVSEKKKESVIPIQFWYLSLVGGLMLLVYAIQIKDPVFTLGQSVGVFVYLRNLYFLHRKKSEA